MANIIRRGEGDRGITRREPQTRDPFRSIADLIRLPFDDLVERSLGFRQVLMPEVDLRETSDTFVLETDVPGFRQDDLEITVSGDRLTIAGRRQPPKDDDGNYLLRERPEGEFVRSFVLPSGTDPNGVRADMKDGVLVMTIPKRPEVQARRITLGQPSSGKA